MNNLADICYEYETIKVYYKKKSLIQRLKELDHIPPYIKKEKKYEQLCSALIF